MSAISEFVIKEDRRSITEIDIDQSLYETYQSLDMPDNQTLAHLGLFLDRISWADYLFMIELYKMSLDVHGVIAEFGVRWGKNLALFSALRAIFEPYNHTRKILGFDTFEGLKGIQKKDGHSEAVYHGAFAVSEGYENTLDHILTCHEAKSPIPQIKKFELIKGDVRNTLTPYLEQHPETIFSLVYLDMDLYEPTKHVLEVIRPYLTKGSIIGFDEVGHPKWPGETTAVAEALGLSSVAIQRMPFSPGTSYIRIE